MSILRTSCVCFVLCLSVVSVVHAHRLSLSASSSRGRSHRRESLRSTALNALQHTLGKTCPHVDYPKYYSGNHLQGIVDKMCCLNDRRNPAGCARNWLSANCAPNPPGVPPRHACYAIACIRGSGNNLVHAYKDYTTNAAKLAQLRQKIFSGRASPAEIVLSEYITIRGIMRMLGGLCDRFVSTGKLEWSGMRSPNQICSSVSSFIVRAHLLYCTHDPNQKRRYFKSPYPLASAFRSHPLSVAGLTAYRQTILQSWRKVVADRSDSALLWSRITMAATPANEVFQKFIVPGVDIAAMYLSNTGGPLSVLSYAWSCAKGYNTVASANPPTALWSWKEQRFGLMGCTLETLKEVFANVFGLAANRLVENLKALPKAIPGKGRVGGIVGTGIEKIRAALKDKITVAHVEEFAKCLNGLYWDAISKAIEVASQQSNAAAQNTIWKQIGQTALSSVTVCTARIAPIQRYMNNFGPDDPELYAKMFGFVEVPFSYVFKPILDYITYAGPISGKPVNMNQQWGFDAVIDLIKQGQVMASGGSVAEGATASAQMQQTADSGACPAPFMDPTLEASPQTKGFLMTNSFKYYYENKAQQQAGGAAAAATHQKCALQTLMRSIPQNVMAKFACMYRNQANKVSGCGAIQATFMSDVAKYYDPTTAPHQNCALNYLHNEMARNHAAAWKTFVMQYRAHQACA
jgi:hypothetical protein